MYKKINEINNYPDNYPVSILNMKNVLLHRSVKNKKNLNVSTIYQKYNGTYQNQLMGGFCISFKDFKDFCDTHNVSDEFIERVINKQEYYHLQYNNTVENLIEHDKKSYCDLSDIETFKAFAKKNKLENKNKNKKKNDLKKIKSFLKVKKTKRKQKNQYKEIENIKNERILFVDLEMPDNQNILSEGALIIYDPKKELLESHYSIFTEESNSFVPNTREFALKNAKKEKEENYIERLKKEIERSDIIVFHGGHYDKKILRKKGVDLDKIKILDLQNIVGKLSLENAILEQSPKYRLDISEKESQLLTNLIKKHVKNPKKKKNKYFSNIATHNAYNDTLILVNLFNELLKKKNNFSLENKVSELNKRAKDYTKKIFEKFNQKKQKIKN